MALLACAVLATPALALQGPWVTPAVDLSVIGQNAESPQVAIAPDGTATAIWIRSNGANTIVQASTRPPGGTFSAPAELSASGGSAESPQVAVAPDGTATAIWIRSNGANTIVQASTRPPGGTFPVPADAVNLSASGQNAIEPQVAVAPDGTATAIWRRRDGATFIVQASTRAPGGAFPVPADAVNLSAGGQNAGEPQVAVAPDGTATAIWWRSDIVQAATRAPGGAFSAAVDLSAGGQTAVDPQVAVAPDGTTTAIWWRSNGTNFIVQASTRAPGGAFATPVDLSAGGQNARSPQVAVAPGGTATATWERSNGTNSIVQAASTATPPVASPPFVAPPAVTPSAPAALPSVAKLVVFPSARKCVSRRRFSIKLRVPRDAGVREAVVRVNGKRVAVRRGSALRSTVDLRSLPKGRFRVEITLKLSDGRSVKDTRRYRTCAPKRRASKR